MKQITKVGIAQIAPIWLDRDATLTKICDYVAQAADDECELLVFGETLLPGYPFWLSSTNGAVFESDLQKDIHAHYLSNAVDLKRGDLKSLCDVAKSRKIAVMVGCYELGSERGGSTGYASLVYVDQKGAIRNAHRKLMPTYEERLSWGIGDGHGLQTFPLGPFQLGGLNCWENWMPLPRAALHAMGENLHVAVWPGSKRITQDITRFAAKEARSFVISASGFLRKSDIPSDFPHRDLVFESFDSEIVSDGGSCIAAPNGTWVIEPFCNEESLLTAELDFQEVLRERQNFDISGHYSRPDVLQLSVNRQRQSCLAEDPASSKEH